MNGMSLPCDRVDRTKDADCKRIPRTQWLPVDNRSVLNLKARTSNDPKTWPIKCNIGLTAPVAEAKDMTPQSRLLVSACL